MKTSKIIFIQPAYAHYRKDLFNKLHKNFDVLFIFLRGKSPYPSSDKADLKWKSICLHSETNRYWMFFLLKILLVKKYDTIVSSNAVSLQSIISFFAAKFLRKGIVIWNIAWLDTYKHSTRPKPYTMLRTIQERYIVKKADSIVVSGSSSLKYHIRIGIPPKKIFIANQSVQGMDKITTSTISKDEIGIQETFVILYLSRIMYLKGLDILLKAFHLLEKKRGDTFLLIGGSGNYKIVCENLSKKLKIEKIKFVGDVPNEKIYDYFHISDVFVLPSCIKRGQTEAWGLVINEAISAGKPVITTDAVGAAEDLVRNGENGYVVKSNNVEEMYEALKKIIDGGKNEIEKMGRYSMKIFDEFNSYNKMFAGFEQAIMYSLKKTNKI